MIFLEWFKARKLNKDLEKLRRGEILPEKDKEIFLFLKSLSSLKEKTPKTSLSFLNLDILPDKAGEEEFLFERGFSFKRVFSFWQVKAIGLTILVLLSLFLPKVLFFHSPKFIGLDKEAIAQEIKDINKNIYFESKEMNLISEILSERNSKGLTYEEIQKEIKEINQKDKKKEREVEEILKIIKEK